MDVQKRFDELDIMKGIGIICIVLGHLEPGVYLMRFLYSFHLFLFFACSGFVGTRYEKRNFLKVVRSNIKRLLIPYFIWNILSQLIDLLMELISIRQAVCNILYLDTSVGWNAALWFLVSLFWTDTFGSLIVKLKRWLQFIVVAMFVALSMVVMVNKISLPLGLYTVPIAIVFWLFGYWMNIYGIYRKIMNINNYLNIGGVLLIVNICCGVVFNQVISIYHMQYKNIPLTIVAGIAGVLFSMLFAIQLNNKGKLTGILILYGRNTMIILCTHYLILRLIGTVSQKLINYNLWRYTSTAKSIFFAVVVIVAYYPVLLESNKLKEKYPSMKYLI